MKSKTINNSSLSLGGHAKRVLPLLLICFGGGALADEVNAPSMADAIKAIQMQEHMVDCVKAKGTYKATHYDGDRKVWLPNGEWDVTGTYEGMPAGKYRIECRKALIPWEGGPAPFEERAFTAVYNGRIGTVLTTKHGDFTKPSNVLSATIEGKRVGLAPSAARATGWAYSIFGITDRRTAEPQLPKRFSDFLTDSQNVPGFRADLVSRNETPFLRVTIPQEKQQGPFGFADMYWLDPKHGYAVYRYEWSIYVRDGQDVHAIQNAAVSSYWEVTQWSQPTANVSYPKHVHMESLTVDFDSQNKPKPQVAIDKTDTVVEEISINDPSVTEDSYKLTLPKGATIQDGLGGVMAVVTGTPEEQKAIIEEQVKKAEEMLKAESGTSTKP